MTADIEREPAEARQVVGSVDLQEGLGIAESLLSYHPRRWWVQLCCELVFLFGVMWAVEWLVLGREGGFVGVAPHPYWLILLPVAAVRGLNAGIAAAIVAGGMHAWGFARVKGGDWVNTLGDPELYVEPVFFLLIAFIVGECRDVLTRRAQKLAQSLLESDEVLQEVHRQREVLAKANRELERTLSEEPMQLFNLIRAAERLDNEPSGLPHGLALELIEEFCGVEASLWFVDPGGALTLVDRRSEKSYEKKILQDRVQASELVREVLHSGRAASHFPSVRKPASPLSVHPLFDERARTTALLCVEELQDGIWNRRADERVRAIVDWYQTRRLRHVAEAQQTEPVLMQSSSNVLRDLHVECARAARYGVPFSVVGLFATGSEAHRQAYPAVDAHLVGQLAPRLRPTDDIYQLDYAGAYMLLLRGTSTDAGREDLLEAGLAGMKHVEWKACSFDPEDYESPEALVAAVIEAFAADAPSMADWSVWKDRAFGGTVREVRVDLIERESRLCEYTGTKTSCIRLEGSGDQQHLIQTLIAGLRVCDQVRVLTSEELELLLPGTDVHGARSVITRLEKRLSAEVELKAPRIEVLSAGRGDGELVAFPRREPA